MKETWTFIDGVLGAFTCKHCGEAVPTPDNCKLDTLVQMGYGFERAHKKCKLPFDIDEDDDAAFAWYDRAGVNQPELVEIIEFGDEFIDRTDLTAKVRIRYVNRNYMPEYCEDVFACKLQPITENAGLILRCGGETGFTIKLGVQTSSTSTPTSNQPAQK